ncbi:hypothetical protein GCM10010967_12850 [Dyadobacter beijingensis]|uniref:PKD domain-containing protein n=2 Tax=Dyadobacter beijingensis TaxID=365489 RepID=A0ABQ2HK40_9BACT|nr:hypothetical protein GCM10010967_12850 [Dyadobacter beijingensis]
MAQVTFTYDNAGNRVRREASTTAPSGCYTMKLAGNGKFLTHVNGVLKVKAASSADNQKWKVETAGAYVKVVAATNSQILGVSGGGNADGDLVTLQANGAQDHQLWTRTIIAGSNPQASVFVRKSSSLLFGSTVNWGDGDPSDLVTDIRLTNDPSFTFGNNKWIFETATCPTAPVTATITPAASTGSPTAETGFNLTSTCSGDCSGMAYSWKLGSTVVGSSGSVAVTAPSTPGNYTYTLTATKTGFTSTTSVTVNVKAVCYTMKLAGNSKLLTNVNGILKVKAANSTDSQKWRLETSGTFVKVATASGNQILGVSGGGNSDGNLITLQANAGQDHLLWTRTAIAGSNPASSVFVRKGSSLIFGSTMNWGDGDPSDLVTDIRLTNDPSYTFGNNKWIFESATCPVYTGRQGVEEEIELVREEASETQEDLVVFPNPTSGEFEVNFRLIEGKSGSLSVVNIEGKVFYQKNVKGAGWHKERINLKTANAGLYIVYLTSENGVRAKKISILK